MRLHPGFSVCFGIAFFVSASDARAELKPLAALFQNSKTSKTKVKSGTTSQIPEEYRVYFKSKSVLVHPSSLNAIETAEKELLLARLKAQSKVLDKEIDELFSALEIKKGSLFAKSKNSLQALQSYQRGLNGMGAFKWIYYWSSADSLSLSKICNRNKKVKDEICLNLAKRLVDAFPKAALETSILRDLPAPETISNSTETSGDRLSQTYSEKVEKDEEAFQEVLEQYLSGKDIDLIKTARSFLSEYPKSILRFRATFLMAESFYRTGSAGLAAPLYQSLMDQLPLSLYAIVSAERLKINLRERVKKEPVMIDLDEISPNAAEKITLERARALIAKKHEEEAGLELDTFTRLKSYHTSFLLYLMRFAYDSKQNLNTFKFANELVQRKYDGFLNNDLLEMIFPERFTKEVEEQASISHVDPLLIESLIKQESSFKAPIISPSGALGLMQLMPFTAIDTKKDLVLATLKNPQVNIEVGTLYLASLLQKYDGNIPYALAAYNAGPHRVAKWRKDNKPDLPMMDWIEAIPYKETRDYVMAILRNRYWYQYRKGLPVQSVFEAWKKVPLDANALPNPI